MSYIIGNFKSRPREYINLEQVTKITIQQNQPHYDDEGEEVDASYEWEVVIKYPSSTTDFRPNGSGVYKDMVVTDFDRIDITTEEKLILEKLLAALAIKIFTPDTNPTKGFPY